MSGKARATIFAVMNCCASRSRSARLRPPCRRRWPAGSANRARTQQPRQKGNRRNQRMPPLPGLELDLRARVAIDLPGDVVGAAGEGEAGLGEAENGVEFPVALLPAPPPPGVLR